MRLFVKTVFFTFSLISTVINQKISLVSENKKTAATFHKHKHSRQLTQTNPSADRLDASVLLKTTLSTNT